MRGAELDTQIDKAAQRGRVSKGEWVRRALKQSLRQRGSESKTNPVERMAALAAVMLNHEIKWVATYDAGFSGIPGIRRLKL